MNPTVDNDLQKAIDDITKNTNTDPVFADPVATPAPEINLAPEPPIPAPTPISDFRPAGAPTMRPVARPAAPRPVESAPAPVNTPEAMPMPPISAPEPIAEPIAEPAPMPEPVMEETFAAEESISAPSDMREVKEAALRDLAPLVSKMNVDASKKFNLYKNIREELHDDSVIGDAYTAAKDIADDTERGEALLYLVESIDNM